MLRRHQHYKRRKSSLSEHHHHHHHRRPSENNIDIPQDANANLNALTDVVGKNRRISVQPEDALLKVRAG